MRIKCRAQITDDCYHGRAAAEIYDPDYPERSYKEDGTFNIEDDSVVCDTCLLSLQPFTRSGRALLEEIPDAIAHYRTQREYLTKVEDLSGSEEEAKRAVQTSRVGSPRHRSSEALLRLVREELRRRKA